MADDADLPDARWLTGLEEAARAALPEAIHRYVRQGARYGVTAAEAPASWQRLRFLPRVLRDVTAVDPAVSLLGTPISAPIAVAPTTWQRAVHPDGELAMARATAESGSLMVVSSNAGTTFAELGGTGVAWWLQCYLTQDRSRALPVLERAVEAGARALVLTADTPVVGTKYDLGTTVWEATDPGLLRVNFAVGDREGPGAEKATDLGPEDIAWLTERTGLPVVVKGVLHPEDARRCVAAGARGIWVSNHGGRQLDRTLPTAEALPGVAAAVEDLGGDGTEVYVDGGIRSGTDVLAALALGARCAFLGRLPLWALHHGPEGVARLHRELTRELVEGMRIAGAASVADARGLAAPSGAGRVPENPL